MIDKIVEPDHHEDGHDAQHPVAAELLVDLCDQERPRHPGRAPCGGKHAEPERLRKVISSSLSLSSSFTGSLLPPTTLENMEADSVRQKG